MTTEEEIIYEDIKKVEEYENHNISFIIVSKNKVQKLTKLVNTLEEVAWEGDEIIVIDLASVDGLSEDMFPSNISFTQVGTKNDITRFLQNTVEHLPTKHVFIANATLDLEKDLVERIRLRIYNDPYFLMEEKGFFCFPKVIVKDKTNLLIYDNFKKLFELTNEISKLTVNDLPQLKNIDSKNYLNDRSENVKRQRKKIPRRTKVARIVSGVITSKEKLDPLVISEKDLREIRRQRKRQKTLDKIDRRKDIRNEVLKGTIVPLDKLPKLVKGERKPRILCVTDVKDWAWWLKSEYLQRYLSDEFIIDIICVLGKEATRDIKTNYDLYLTFGHSYIKYLRNVPFEKRITGITAHRQFNVLAPRMAMANVIHANSKLLLSLAKELHKNVFYVPNGVDEEMFSFKPIDPNRGLVVGHIGKLSPLKGQKEIIEPAVKKAGVKYFHHYNDYTKNIPHKDMPKLYENFDVFIVASQEDGTPCPALEAAASGRPIISNRIGNMPEFIVDGYNGFLVDDDIDEYVEKILFFKENRNKLIEMGINARKTVEEDWTWKLQIENYRKMFEEILY